MTPAPPPLAEPLSVKYSCCAMSASSAVLDGSRPWKYGWNDEFVPFRYTPADVRTSSAYHPLDAPSALTLTVAATADPATTAAAIEAIIEVLRIVLVLGHCPHEGPHSRAGA
jgi:hypothetical protein